MSVWSRVSRQSQRDDRLPPGQHDVGGSFPVLTAEVSPRIRPQEWTFRIDGLVARTTTWTWEEIHHLPRSTYRGDIHCVTSWSTLGTSFSGVSVDDLLDAVRVGARATQVIAWSHTGYTTNLPLEHLTGGKTWVVWEHEGRPLPPEHGGPARLLVPHLYFWRSVPPGAQRHVPGQHYVVRIPGPDGGRAQRSYSIASAPLDPGPDGVREVELTVERLDGGAVSPYLQDMLGPGDQVEVRGPFGGWFIWSADTPALLVGGGSGVVPLMAMVRHWRARGRPVPLHLLVSVHEPGDLYYRDELGAETTVVHTRTAPDGDVRPAGRLTADDLRPLLLPGATCYVCGSAGFAEHASQLLVTLGVDPRLVRVERFGPS